MWPAARIPCKKSRVRLGLPHPNSCQSANENAGFLACSYWGRLSKQTQPSQFSTSRQKEIQDKERSSRPIESKPLFGTAHLPLWGTKTSRKRKTVCRCARIAPDRLDPCIAVLTPVRHLAMRYLTDDRAHAKRHGSSWVNSVQSLRDKLCHLAPARRCIFGCIDKGVVLYILSSTQTALSLSVPRHSLSVLPILLLQLPLVPGISLAFDRWNIHLQQSLYHTTVALPKYP